MTKERIKRKYGIDLEGRTEHTRIFKKAVERDDEDRKYISVCTYWVHVGICFTPKICIKRDCSHLKRLYIDG